MQRDMTAASESITWRAHARVLKYDGDQSAWAEGRMEHSGLVPFSAMWRAVLAGVLRTTGEPGDGIAEAAGNLLVTSGAGALTALFVGSGGTAFSNTHGIVGVGNSATPAAIGDVALGADGTANAFYQGCDSTFPSASGGTISVQSTFASGVAQFSWAEWCWGTSTGTVSTSNSTTLHTAGGSGGWAGGTVQVMINHKIPVPALGTKGAVSWVFQTSATIS
jgi:hypothetical protein